LIDALFFYFRTLIFSLFSSPFLSSYGLTDDELTKSPLSKKIGKVIELKMSDTDDVVVSACTRTFRRRLS